MDPYEELFVNSMYVPKSDLLAAAELTLEAYTKARSDDPGPYTLGGTTKTSCMLHAAMIRRGMDVEALDFFSRLNAVASPLPPYITYTEYVKVLRSL